METHGNQNGNKAVSSYETKETRARGGGNQTAGNWFPRFLPAACKPLPDSIPLKIQSPISKEPLVAWWLAVEMPWLPDPVSVQ